jgi:hypothetical protein
LNMSAVTGRFANCAMAPRIPSFRRRDIRRSRVDEVRQEGLATDAGPWAVKVNAPFTLTGRRSSWPRLFPGGSALEISREGDDVV